MDVLAIGGNMRRDILIRKDEMVINVMNHCSTGIKYMIDDFDYVIYEALSNFRFKFDDDSSIRFETDGYKSISAGIYVITFDYHVNCVNSTGLRLELVVTCKVHKTSKYADVVYWFSMGI